jgi:uncharacterized protein YbjT (DUF2867 family)
MAERRVVLFGGSGFVGRLLAPCLVGHGWTVRVASRQPERSIRDADGRLKTIVADLRSEDQVRRRGFSAGGGLGRPAR